MNSLIKRSKEQITAKLVQQSVGRGSVSRLDKAHEQHNQKLKEQTTSKLR